MTNTVHNRLRILRIVLNDEANTDEALADALGITQHEIRKHISFLLQNKLLNRKWLSVGNTTPVRGTTVPTVLVPTARTLYALNNNDASSNIKNEDVIRFHLDRLGIANEWLCSVVGRGSQERFNIFQAITRTGTHDFLNNLETYTPFDFAELLATFEAGELSSAMLVRLIEVYQTGYRHGFEDGHEAGYDSGYGNGYDNAAYDYED